METYKYHFILCLFITRIVLQGNDVWKPKMIIIRFTFESLVLFLIDFCLLFNICSYFKFTIFHPPTVVPKFRIQIAGFF